MFPVFALIFLLVPLIEIYILIQVGQVIGALWTVFFVVLTAVIGVQLLKSQGLSTLSRAQHKMDSGEMPAQELMEGIRRYALQEFGPMALHVLSRWVD